MIKLIAFDMDGTFLRADNSYDRPRFERLYRRLAEKGVKTVVISGNQYAQLASFFPDHQEELTIVSENGALIFEEGRLLYEQVIAREEVEQILAVLKEQGLDRTVTICGLHSAYLLASAPQSFKKEIGIYYHALQEVEEFSRLPEDDWVKLALLVPEAETERLLASINQAAGPQVQAVSSGHGSIDIIQKGVHKGAALAYLGRHWGIEVGDMMAFGDGDNDLDMLAYVGESYAMANASAAVKAVSKYQTLSNEESGVLAAIEKVLPGI